jgi:phosphosulfolactate phosphohydrolase-like enzyme
VFPARSSDEAAVRAASLPGALLVGELGGNKPVGFDITNSPAEIAQRTDVHRPMVFVSSSGTQLIMNASGGDAVYLACIRNYSALARHLAANHESVAIIGAGTRGQFRREDQIGCVLVACALLDMGYEAQTQRTMDCIALGRRRRRPSGGDRERKSAAHLKKPGQHEDWNRSRPLATEGAHIGEAGSPIHRARRLFGSGAASPAVATTKFAHTETPSSPELPAGASPSCTSLWPWCSVAGSTSRPTRLLQSRYCRELRVEVFRH